jgi:UDP-sulfoquinovose synthase
MPVPTTTTTTTTTRDEKQTIFVVGGDGFCGWPLSLRLSTLGYRVVILDNYSRRTIDDTLGHASLVRIASPEVRVRTWNDLLTSDGGITGVPITTVKIDLSEDRESLVDLIHRYKPGTIVHLGEQRSAPYSMLSAETSQYTVRNNVLGTHNLLLAIIATDPGIHLVHLGTMGRYGYGAIKDQVLPEGYMDVKMCDAHGEDVTVEIDAPTYPGSVYHTTKVMDSDLFRFHAKNSDLRITDLQQGIVYGVATPETNFAPELANRVDVCSLYGTVLNRFIVQAAMGEPLSVYGVGGQTRAFIHIEDSIRCMVLAIQNPPDDNKIRMYNQTTETHRVVDLAARVSRLFGATVRFLPNPRNELATNMLHVKHCKLQALGLSPTLLTDDYMTTVYNLAVQNRDNLIKESLNKAHTWK